MANVNGFNADIDKITEREVVYDFVSRLSFGKEVRDTEFTNDILFYKDHNLKDAIIRIAMGLPTYANDTLFACGTFSIDINPGDTAINYAVPNNTITNGANGIKAAILEGSGVDIKSMITVSSDWSLIQVTFDTPFTQKDTLKVYYIPPFVM